MGEAVCAEWTKLRSLASTYWLLLAVVIVTVAVSVAAMVTSTYQPGDYLDTAKLSFTGVDLGQAVIAVLAVVTMSNEYSTGMIRTTLTAMPHRLTMLTAKAAIIVCTAVVGGSLAVAGCLLAGRVILPGRGYTGAHGYPLLSVFDGSTARAAIGSVLYLALIALLSLGVATAVRDSAVATGIVLGLLYVFPLVTQAVSDPTWHRHLEQIGPMTAGLAIEATTSLQGLAISPWAGLAVLGAWSAGALLTGGALLRLRDA
jgi:ABC-2 type transport system permease protein